LGIPALTLSKVVKSEKWVGALSFIRGNYDCAVNAPYKLAKEEAELDL